MALHNPIKELYLLYKTFHQMLWDAHIHRRVTRWNMESHAERVAVRPPVPPRKPRRRIWVVLGALVVVGLLGVSLRGYWLEYRAINQWARDLSKPDYELKRVVSDIAQLRIKQFLARPGYVAPKLTAPLVLTRTDARGFIAWTETLTLTTDGKYSQQYQFLVSDSWLNQGSSTAKRFTFIGEYQYYNGVLLLSNGKKPALPYLVMDRTGKGYAVVVNGIVYQYEVKQ